MPDYIQSYAEAKQYNFHFYSIPGDDTVSFPALLTQLEDSFSSNWNSQNVFGRQDPILTFQNTQRTMNVAFDVPSHSANDAVRNLKKLNKLINFLYPVYDTSDSANTISASPLFRIKFANLIYDQSITGEPGNDPKNGLVCAISGFKHQFKFDGSAGWLDKIGSAIPASFSISFSAAILHTHDLGKVNGEYRSENEFPYFIESETDFDDVAGPSPSTPYVGDFSYPESLLETDIMSVEFVDVGSITDQQE